MAQSPRIHFSVGITSSIQCKTISRAPATEVLSNEVTVSDKSIHIPMTHKDVRVIRIECASVKGATGFDKSFMKMAKNNGPKMDPWGTPHDSKPVPNLLPFSITVCLLRSLK